VPEIICPLCGKRVLLDKYGWGWVGVCCGAVIYNETILPKTTKGSENEETKKSWD
jgi:hypothetical protein